MTEYKIMTEDEIKNLKYEIWEGAMAASERRGRDGFAAAKKLIEYYEKELARLKKIRFILKEGEEND